ncbi:PQQ-dependent sugar dehydrogenase [Dawidia soli]|uniref:Sorbosone dehydrogenase family protein n=1 Tax=Dawidia soli TaxID=2782352 RepID=A0AAP2D436_9BACT|nr:sorbosone dehydrogenase family protein [Dawidia soli]
MKLKNYLIILAAMAAMAFSCSDDDADDDNGNQPAPPVETNPPNTDYEPAFEGQTRIDGVLTTTEYESRIITSDLDAPWGVTSLPDGRLLITEKGGTMRIVTATGTVSSAITGIPDVNSAGQGGLLGLCLDPQFASNRMVYWAFSENVSGGTVTSVAKGRLADDETKIENATVIYRVTPAYPSDLHYGGRVIFDGSGNLFLSTGERSVLPTRPLAQSVESSLGKIVRITTDGQPASGNPTFSGDGALPELYSIGHRNPQGIARHPETGDLWELEHGPRGGDEVNRIRAGVNYGWPTITYGIEYSGATIGDGIQQKEGMEQPVYYWDPVISPSGITFYKGDRVPEWKNNLFISSLSAKHIARLVMEDNRVVGEERLLASENQRFRDITQGTDNALYAVTDEGRLYRIDRKTDTQD